MSNVFLDSLRESDSQRGFVGAQVPSSIKYQVLSELATYPRIKYKVALACHGIDQALRVSELATYLVALCNIHKMENAASLH